MVNSQMLAAWVALLALAASAAALGEDIKVNRMNCYAGTVTLVSADKTLLGSDQDTCKK